MRGGGSFVDEGTATSWCSSTMKGSVDDNTAHYNGNHWGGGGGDKRALSLVGG